MSARPRWEPTDTRAALALSVAACALRVLFLISIEERGWPHSALYEGDAPVWIEWARALRAGQPFEFDLPVRAPGMAFLIEALGGDLAAPFTGLKLLSCAMGAATVGLFFVALRAHVSRRAATIAALLLALSFGQLELATSLNNEAPYLLLVVGALAIHVWTRERRSPALALGLGVVHGLANLLRSEHVAFVALLLGLELVRARAELGRTLARAALSAAGLLLVSLPWILRSHAALERFNTYEPRAVPWEGARPPWSAAARAGLHELPAFCREGLFLMLSDRARRAGARSVERADLDSLLDETFGYRPEPLGAWTLSSAKGRLDLALANELTGDGGFSRAALADAFDEDPPFSFGRPSHLRLWLHGHEVAWRAIREQTGRWIALVGRKLARFGDGLCGGLGAQNLPMGMALSRAPIDLAVARERSLAWQLAWLVTACVGASIALRRDVGSEWLLWLAFKLLVTVAFYGYARQGVTAQLALHALVALALDAGLARLPARASRLCTQAAWLLVGFLGSNAGAQALEARRFDVRPVAGARIVPAQQWGSGGFECQGSIELAPAPYGVLGER